MKNRIALFVAGCIALLLSSCLDSDDNTYEVPKDCQITSFSMSNDSVRGVKLDTVKFVIDQVNGYIFNPDSLPFGTEIEKVVCTLTYASTMAGIEVTQEALPDSTFAWNLEDSLNFSKPVKFVTTAFDGVTKKTYRAYVNIHQVVPDSMVWSLYASDVVGYPMKEQKVIAWGETGNEYYYMYAQPTNTGKGYTLYRSPVSDARNWTELTLTGLPVNEVRLSQMVEYEGELFVPTIKGALYQSANGEDWTLVGQTPSIKSLLGTIAEGGMNQASVMAAVVDNNGSLKYAVMNEDLTWEEGDDLSAGFPVSGFGALSHESMFRQSLMVIAGKDKDGNLLNSAWSTMNGKAWTMLTDIESDYFGKREGVMLSYYDKRFCMIGGIDGLNKALKDMYFSNDGGVSWFISDTLTVMPEDYKARGFASVAVDKENYMLIFGGKESNSGNVMDQIWRGRINRLGFKE